MALDSGVFDTICASLREQRSAYFDSLSQNGCSSLYSKSAEILFAAYIPDAIENMRDAFEAVPSSKLNSLANDKDLLSKLVSQAIQRNENTLYDMIYATLDAKLISPYKIAHAFSGDSPYPEFDASNKYK